MSNSRIGFDIGTGELKLAQCDGGRVKRTVIQPLPDNLVREGRIVSYEAMGDFIKETLRKNRVRGRDCAVVLPAGLAFLRTVTLPAMTVDQLKVNLPFEFKDYLTAAKEKYFYDYALHDMRADDAGTPVEMTLTAAATAKETIAEYGAMFRRAGLRLRAAAPVECAYANLLRLLPPGEGGEAERCILDLGHHATRIHIYTGSRLEATRVIDIGGEDVDGAIADALSVDEHVARSFKESNHDESQALESARSVYSAIAVEVMKAVNFYGFNNRDSNLKDAYLCGGGGRVEPLREAITAAVDLTLHSAGDLIHHVEKMERNLELCAAAAGIAMQ